MRAGVQGLADGEEREIALVGSHASEIRMHFPFSVSFPHAPSQCAKIQLHQILREVRLLSCLPHPSAKHLKGSSSCCRLIRDRRSL